MALALAGCAGPPVAVEQPHDPTPAPTSPPFTIPTPPPNPRVAVDSDRTSNPPARAVRGGPPVHRAPDLQSPIISGLYYDTALPLLEERTAEDGVRWFRTRLWGVLDGWIQADHIVVDTPEPVRPFWETSDAVKPPWRGTAPPQNLTALGVTNSRVSLRTGPGTDWRVQQVLPQGMHVQVRSWATDDDSHAWYSVTAGQAKGWLYTGAVDLQVADPLRPVVHGQPLASLVAGKGMWLPYPLLEMADEHEIVAASKKLGLTHIFVEAAETSRGFYAREEVARLLPAAQAAGLRVVAWITTGLFDLPLDVELSVKVATFRTEDGHMLDGIAPDIEQNMRTDDVKAYAEIVRSLLGDDYLIVGVIYPAGGWFGREYPIQSVLARVFNALAPMAYWKDQRREYAYGEVYEYIATNVYDMRAAAGVSDYPVHIIGQMYDTFGRNGTGVHNPTREEIEAALQAARDTGAVGISFFQWGTASPEEWAALRDFAW